MGTETSKYQQEKKINLMIPKVVASEIGRGQTKVSNNCGVADCIIALTNDSRNVLGKHTKDGESPVSEIVS